MKANFIEVDRYTPYLLPPSVQDWLPEKHLARFVVEIVEQLDLNSLKESYAGRGSKPYHPEMLVTLLFYPTPFSNFYPTGIALIFSTTSSRTAFSTFPFFSKHIRRHTIADNCGEQFQAVFKRSTFQLRHPLQAFGHPDLDDGLPWHSKTPGLLVKHPNHPEREIHINPLLLLFGLSGF
jgi:hypothetical protein